MKKTEEVQRYTEDIREIDSHHFDSVGTYQRCVIALLKIIAKTLIHIKHFK